MIMDNGSSTSNIQMELESNITANFCLGSSDNDSAADHSWSKIILGFLYSLVFILAVSGNSLVIYVVVSNRFMHNVTNMFITNLAIADLFVNFTSLWLTPTYSFMNKWIWGKALCHSAPLFQGSSLFISTLTLTAIAIDRYIVILHPFRQRVSCLVCLTVIVSIWVLSGMLVMPLAVNMQLRYFEDCDAYYCFENWPWKELKTIYGIVVLVFQFGVPFGIIAVCYVKIWYYLNHRQTIAVSSSDVQRKRKLLKMLVSMVVIFALCHLALNVLNILRDFEVTFISKSNYFTLFFLIAHLFSMSATCWNPILYAGMNENFQREFKAVLPCFRTRMRTNRACSYSRANVKNRQTTSCNGTVQSNGTTGKKSDVVTNGNELKGNPMEKNGTVLVFDEKREIYTNGSCYLIGRTENDEDINFIPDTIVTIV